MRTFENLPPVLGWFPVELCAQAPSCLVFVLLRLQGNNNAEPKFEENDTMHELTQILPIAFRLGGERRDPTKRGNTDPRRKRSLAAG